MVYNNKVGLQFFLDKDLKNEVNPSEINLGRDEVGEKTVHTIYFKTSYPVNFEDLNLKLVTPTGTAKELKVLSFPTELKNKQVGEIVIEWTPSLPDLSKGIKPLVFSLNITGTVVGV